MPTFAFPSGPPQVALRIRPRWNAPLPVQPKVAIHSFGTVLDARLLSTPGRSTSELLRTL